MSRSESHCGPEGLAGYGALSQNSVVDVAVRMRVTRSIRTTLFIAAFMLCAPVRSVCAQQLVRVVVAGEDSALGEAIRSTLEPWGVEVRLVEGQPGAEMPSSADRGRAIAEANHAAAVVWVSTSEAGASLSTYDRESDRVSARRLPSAPPFDDATLVAVALSVKALLRHSSVAPPGERLEAARPRVHSMVRLEARAGARAFSTSPSDVEPRGTVAVAIWPDGAFALTLGVRSGTGVGVISNVFSGRLLSMDGFIGARLRWAPESLLDLGVALEVGASLELLEGTLVASRHSLTRAEIDPVMGLVAELGWRPLGALRLGLRAGLELAPRTRTYLVRAERVLATEPARLVVELSIEIPIDGGNVDLR